MKFLDLLAKLGILRYGTKKATWKSGKDLPAEFLMDDVYNAERDLVNKDDVTAVKDALTGKNEEK